MQNFLSTIGSSLSASQGAALRRFLQDTNASRVPTSTDTIRAALENLGELLLLPNLDPTTPEGYNGAIQTLIANIAGLYGELDRLESIHDALDDLNRTELDRIEVAVRDLATLLAATQSAYAANTQWSDVFYETFGASVARETARDWYKPIPALASSGQIESFLPLSIDPEDRSLKLFPGGDFSRTTNARGDRLAQVSIDELLGLSVDPNHPLDQAVDGRYFTFWRELILSTAPIEADPLQVPWLPETYVGGAAARLQFHWSFAVPFTELLVRPFSRYPIQVLQVVWDNRRIAATNKLSNPDFVSGAAYWSFQGTPGASISYPATGGWSNKSYANINLPSGRAVLTSTNYVASGTEFAFHLTGRVWRSRSAAVSFRVVWNDAATGTLRTDAFLPTIPCEEWFEVSKLFIAPSGWVAGVAGSVSLSATGSGSIYFTEARFAPVLGSRTVQEQSDLESDSLTVALDNANGTDLWMVIAQPHYEFLQVALPEGELTSQQLWQEVRLAAETKATGIQQIDQIPWSVEAGDPGRPSLPLATDGSSLVREAGRLGGRIKDAALRLLQYARPSARSRLLTRYLYLLGAWEIQVRHREYAPQGLFVSLPFKPRGEAREAVLITDPPFSELSDRVKFWLTARSEDRSDKAHPFFGRATFTSATENPSNTADCHFVLPPIARREIFEQGTDRNNRIALQDHPYVDRERVWNIQTRLTSGSIANPLVYDPNKEVIYLTEGSNVVAVNGYRPIGVTLEFADGTVARPDVLGKVQKGDIGLSEKEILTTATVEQEITFLNENAQRRIEQRVAKAKPANRAALEQKLIQQELQKTLLQSTKQQKTSTKKVSTTALQTRFRNIVASPNGVDLSLYWHKSEDDLILHMIITSGDVRVSPARYVVDAQNGVIILRDAPPSGNSNYNSFIAYYHYYQSESGAREAFDSRAVHTIPTSGIDIAGSLTQGLLTTRLASDLVRGETRALRPPVLDELDTDYYPVFEYLIDDRGRLQLSTNLSAFGDAPARIIVEYTTLAINPRLLISYVPKAINEISTLSPRLASFTLLLNSRR